MKLTNLPALALLSCFSLQAAANSGYEATCNSISFAKPGDNSGFKCYEILADCEKYSGIYTIDTYINVQKCFANSNGQLVARQNGGFAGSCKDVSLSGTILKASCANNNGKYVSSSIDTNDYIGNVDGGLFCFNSVQGCAGGT